MCRKNDCWPRFETDFSVRHEIRRINLELTARITYRFCLQLTQDWVNAALFTLQFISQMDLAEHRVL